MRGKILLTQREWSVDGTWYAPLHHLRDNFNSVVYCAPQTAQVIGRA
ncbi:MAG: hypothetical protein SNJ29_13005 [Rikenellaceae bacterium]